MEDRDRSNSTKEPVPQDYPAAHSMDTMWFAIDQAGHVGIFFTGEDGPMPALAHDGNTLHVLQELRGVRPVEQDDDFEPDYRALDEEAADLGLFTYEYIAGSEDWVYPYSYTVMPGTPRHLEQLPPGLRWQFKHIRFPGLFPQCDDIQLAEHTSVFDVWFYYQESVAYLASDRKTVRAIPGKEAEFAAFCQDFRQRFPDRAKPFTFEGQPEPAPPKRSRRRSKDSGPTQGGAEG
jgi:hypothetical protein